MKNFIAKVSMKTTELVFLLLLITGCAEYDRLPATRFEPAGDCDAGHRCFMYQAPAYIFAEKDSESGERYRMKMLEAWLRDNGFQGKSYEIISRVPICRGGVGYTIFYKVRVKE